MQIQFSCFHSTLALALFGIQTIAFWMYVAAFVILIIGLIKIAGELPKLNGVDKIMPFGRLFFAIPLAVFGSEHFTITTAVANLVPRWIPAPTFWAYLTGIAFILAALSIVTLVQARLAAFLVGMTMLIFVLVMDMPGVVAQPVNRFFWALALRQLAFSGGALALAMSLSQTSIGWTTIPRLFIGVPSVFYGVEHFLHPEYVPGIPLDKLSPDWIPGRIALSYFVGVVLVLAGMCLVLGKKSRLAAIVLGLAILLTVLWIYLPMLLVARTDVVAMNFFFDTLLFSGAVLLLANALNRERALNRS